MKIHHSHLLVALTLCVPLWTSRAATTWYVATNGDDVADGITWATAKATVQAAIDVAASNDVVLVSNGVYATGGRVVYGALTNRIAVTNAITIRSQNGPTVTTIQGAKDPLTTNGNAAVRCVFLGAYAVLSGFTLCNGATRADGDADQEQSGGGVWCDAVWWSDLGVLSNCVLTGNSANYLGGGSYQTKLHLCTLTGNWANYGGGGSCYGSLSNCTLNGNSAPCGGGAFDSPLERCTISANSAANGGGSYYGMLYHCTLSGNSATNYGGGAYHGQLENCLLTGNSAPYGGGCSGASLKNCTVSGNSASHRGGADQAALGNCVAYFNSAPDEPNHGGCTFNYSCTTPWPVGTGNITNDPQFVNMGTGNYRLDIHSPCIDRGNNQYVASSAETDLDGHPRIAYGVVDMGAYENQEPLGYWAWVLAVTNGLTNYTDCSTGDGYPNLLKYVTGSSATNPDDLARLTASISNVAVWLRFSRNTNAVDATLVVQGASTITNGTIWEGLATNLNGSWGNASNVNENGSGSVLTCAIRDPIPYPTNRFLRLVVTRP